VTYVTDTHPFVYHVTGRKQRLGRRARSIFDRSDRGTDTIVVPFSRTGRSPSSNRDRADSYPHATPRFCSVVGQSVNVDLAFNDTAVLLESSNFHDRSRPVRSNDHRPGQSCRPAAYHRRRKDPGIRFGSHCLGLGRLSKDSIVPNFQAVPVISRSSTP
jgi:hypothetical protein